MDIEEIIKILGLIGIGGILKSFIDIFLERKKQKNTSLHGFKEPRYKAIIILLYALFDYDSKGNKLSILRPDIKSKNDLIDELYTEWISMALYAPDNVIINMKLFLDDQSINNFNEVIISMRKDLYSIRTKLKNDNLLTS